MWEVIAALIVPCFVIGFVIMMAEQVFRLFAGAARFIEGLNR
jgi:hypothetical protein